jgi:hypothetical protein
MEVAGDTLWLLEQYTGLVYSWPTHGATQATLRGDLAILGASGDVWGVATDGREVFFGMGDSIYAVDTVAPTFSARIVAGQVIPYAAGDDCLVPAKALLRRPLDEVMVVV